MTTLERLFDPSFAFDSPATVALSVFATVGIALGLAVPALARKSGRMSDELAAEVTTRSRTWVLLAVLIGGPILLGAAWVVLGLCVLALLCHREFARATGLFRCGRVSATVAVAIVLLFAAAADHWRAAFFAVLALTPTAIAVAAMTSDRPRGFVQRVALGVFSFLFIGGGLGHLGFLANDADFRPILLTVIAATQLNDVFAFVCGKAFGRRKLCPNTSPGKTVAGAAGAVCLTTALVAGVGALYLGDRMWAGAGRLVLLGLLLSVAGQLGDLLLSSVKRDAGIKDMGSTLPGHGGLLDRFDSLLLAGPAACHFLLYFRGIGEDQPVRILSWLLPGWMP